MLVVARRAISQFENLFKAPKIPGVIFFHTFQFNNNIPIFSSLSSLLSNGIKFMVCKFPRKKEENGEREKWQCVAWKMSVSKNVIYFMINKSAIHKRHT